MNKTKIEWVKNPDGTQGYTWNPITGCLKRCEYCYARRLANTRLKKVYRANKNIIPRKLDTRWPVGYDAYADPFYPRFWEDRLFQPMNDRHISEKGIFVCDMSDLFGIGVPEIWTKSVMDVIEDCPTDRFYLLTKQPQNLQKFSPFPDNVYLGVSATDSEQYRSACVGLTVIQAKVRFISFEPLLEQIPQAIPTYELSKEFVDWVIIGAQTKPTVYPKIEWVREIVGACDKAGIPVFLKDNLRLLLGRDYSKGVKGYAPMWAYPHNVLRQELPSND